MGMMIFIMASGLTLVFGLMDVMNFAHGAFITIGAYVAATVLKLLARADRRRQPRRRISRPMLPAMLAAMALAGVLGLVLRARASSGRSTAST